MFFNLTTLGETDYVYSSSTANDNFHLWSLTSIGDNNIYYKFDLETKSSDIEIVNDFKLYQNYQKFPSYKFGNTQYKKGRLTTLPYSYNPTTYEFTTDIALLNNLIAFINNKQPKILTTASGDKFKVVTVEANYKYYDDIAQQPYLLSFSFIQIGNVS